MTNDKTEATGYQPPSLAAQRLLHEAGFEPSGAPYHSGETPLVPPDDRPWESPGRPPWAVSERLLIGQEKPNTGLKLSDKLVVAALAVLGLLTILVIGVSGSDEAKAPATGFTTMPAVPEAEVPTINPPTKAPARVLTAKAFQPKVKVKTKQCFGTYGCNVTFEVQLAITDADRVALENGDKSYEVSFEVKGDKDGPILGTYVIDSDGDYSSSDEIATIATSKTKMTVKITDVERLPF